MILTIRLNGKELKEIEELVLKGEVESVHDFIRYAIQNQLQLEKEKLVKKRDKDYHLLNIANEVTCTKRLISHINKIKSTQKIDISSTETDKFTSLDALEIRERTREPIWALKNKYFPLKFVLRVIQKMVSISNEGKVPISSLRDEIKRLVFPLTNEIKLLDKRMGNKRGNRIATGFPENNEDSFDRFFKNFVTYVSPDGKTIKGLPYELGFIDVVDDSIILTEDGNNFANLYSPVLDGYLIKKETLKYQFSDEELNFLYNHIKQKTISEVELFRFMLSQIKNGINTPEELNNTIRPFLEEKFPKNGGYSEKAANSIRAGVTSRMVELRLINIEKIGGRSFYEVVEGSKMFEKKENEKEVKN